MVFQSTISNEQTAELPSARFDGRIVIIENEAQVEELYKDLSTQKFIGFDTETRPSFKAGVSYKVSLLQLSTPKCCYLVRLCRMKLHPAILKILSNPNIKKIGADVAGDIRSLHVLRNFKERGFIDLQHMASYWGIEEKSLRKMSALVIGKRVSKAQRLSNWEASALTPQQQMYAATDAWVCIEIYKHLMAAKPIKELPSFDISVEAEVPKTDKRPHRRPYRANKHKNRKDIQPQKYENTNLSSTR